MKNFTLKLKRVLAVLILLTSFVDAALPVMAMDTITQGQVLNPVVNNGVTYGADLKSVTGATVTTNQTNANIYTPGQASYLQWNTLNVAPGQSMNYEFGTAGANSFNSVIGGGMTRMAGSLTTSGQPGRIIWSNPNGILFEAGSYTNANALLLTTQEIKNFNLNADDTANVTWGKSGKGGIQIGGGDTNNAAVMRIANDLSIISPKIAIKGADLLAGDVKLITSDGIQYIAALTGSRITNVQDPSAIARPQSAYNFSPDTTYTTTNGTTTSIINNAILVKDSAIAIKDNAGKVYFITKSNDTNASIAALNSAIDGKVTMDVGGSADLEVLGDLNIIDSNVGVDLIAKSVAGELNLTGNNTVNNVDITTLNEYISQNRWAITLDTISQLLKGTLTWDQFVAIRDNHMGDTINAVTTTTNNYTNTSISGGKGNVSIANTTVGGSATVDGANVTISNLVAKSLSATSSASNGFTYTRDGSRTITVANADYKWQDNKWEVYQKTGSHTESYWFFGWHTRTVNDYGWVATNTKPTGNYSALHLPINGNYYLSDGTFVAQTPTPVETPNVTHPDAYPTKNPVASTGTMNLSNITLATDGETKSANTLMANAADSISLSSSKVGDVGLYSAKDISISNSTIGNSIDNILTTDNSKKGLVAGTTIGIIDTIVKGNLIANAGSDITINGLTTESVKGAAGSVTLTSKGDITLDKSDLNTNKIAGALSATSSQTTTSITPANKTKIITKTRGDVTIKETEIGGKLTATANNINVTNNSSASNLNLKAYADTVTTTVSGQITNEVKTGGDITLDNFKTTKTTLASTLDADNNITITNNSQLLETITANAANDITITNSQLGTTTANATAGKLLVQTTDNNNKTTLASLESNSNKIELKNSTINGLAGLTATGTSSTGTGYSDGISINNSAITGKTTANAEKNITITGSTLATTEANADGKLTVQKADGWNGKASKLASLTSNSGEIAINDSEVTGNANLNTTSKGISIDNATIGSISNSVAKTTFSITDSTVNGNTTATGTTGLTVTNSSLKGTNVLTATTGNLSIQGATLGTTSANSTTLDAKDGSVSMTKYAPKYKMPISNTVNGNLTATAGTTATIADTTVNNGDVSVTAKGLIDVDNLTTQLSSKYKGNATGSVDLKTNGDITVDGSHIASGLTAESVETTIKGAHEKTYSYGPWGKYESGYKTTDTTTRGNVTITSTKVGEQLTAKGNQVEVTSSSAKNLDLTALADYETVTKTNYTPWGAIKEPSHSTKSTEGGSIRLNGVTTSGSTESKLTADNSINTTNTHINNNAKLTAKAKDITLDSTTATDLDANAVQTLAIKNDSEFRHVKAFATDINIDDSKIGGWTTSQLTASNNVGIYGSEISNTTVKANGGDITVAASRTGRTYHKQLVGSTLTNSTLEAGRDIKVSDAAINNYYNQVAPGMKAGRDLSIADTIVNGNLVADAGNNITINGLTTNAVRYTQLKGDVKLTAKGDISLDASKKTRTNNIAGTLSAESLETKTSNSKDTYDWVHNWYGWHYSKIATTKTDTTSRGNVSIASTKVGGELTAKGDQVEVTNSSAKNLNLTALADKTTVNTTTYGFRNSTTSETTNSSKGGSIVLTNTKTNGYTKSTLNADNDITLNNTKLNNVIADAGRDINVQYGSALSRASVDAGNDVNVEYGSKINDSLVNAGNDINVKYGSEMNRSIASAMNNININYGSRVHNSFIRAGEDLNVMFGSSLRNVAAFAGNNANVEFGSAVYNSLLAAMNDINVNYGSSINSSLLGALNDINIENSTIRNVNLNAFNNINIYNTNAAGNLIATAQNGNIDLAGVDGIASRRSKDVEYATATLTTKNAKIIETEDGTTTTGKVIVYSSNLGDTTISSANNSNITDSVLGTTKISAGNDVGIYGSSLGDTTITKANNVGIYNDKYGISTLNSADITANNDVEVWNSDITNDLKITTTTAGNVTLAGAFVGNDLTISGANSVWIGNDANAQESGKHQNILTLAEGSTPISDYNRARFNDASFTDYASTYGAPYGEGTRISYIGGNANISNVNDLTIINTAIKGNLTESNIVGDSGLIYSYVGGDYTTDGPTALRDESVYKSYIKGKFVERYPDNTNFDDVNKLRYGSPLDTTFKPHFTPKGFAASEDELIKLKNATKSSMVKGKSGNSFRFTQGFAAY